MHITIVLIISFCLKQNNWMRRCHPCIVMSFMFTIEYNILLLPILRNRIMNIVTPFIHILHTCWVIILALANIRKTVSYKYNDTRIKTAMQGRIYILSFIIKWSGYPDLFRYTNSTDSRIPPTSKTCHAIGR